MKSILFVLFIFLFSFTSTSAQINPDGTGAVNGYFIGPSTDLSGADLSGTDLSGANLTNATLNFANLSDANLTNANLTGAYLFDADLTGANLTNANLREAGLEGAFFIGADLTNTDLYEARTLVSEPGGSGATPVIFSVITAVSKTLYEDIKALQDSQIHAGGISPAQATAISSNTIKIEGIISDVATQFETLGNNDTAIGEQLTSLGQNDILIGEQMTILGENDQSIGEQMATLSQNDETIMAEINAMKAQLQTLVAAVAQKDAEIAEKDEEIAELKQGGGGQTLEQVLEQVQDARLGSVVLNPDAEGNMTLKLEIEESSDLSVWENSGESVEVELPLAEGKKFLRFALK
ncbi:pentapeptide repeat-containing protein [bacterium]|nr:pentapeptide repeat-containing protein [bacterium]